MPCGRLSWLLVRFWAHVNIVVGIGWYTAGCTGCDVVAVWSPFHQTSWWWEQLEASTMCAVSSASCAVNNYTKETSSSPVTHKSSVVLTSRRNTRPPVFCRSVPSLRIGSILSVSRSTWCSSTITLNPFAADPIKALQVYTLPYMSNPPFLFLTFGRSGAQDWAPERPNVKN